MMMPAEADDEGTHEKGQREVVGLTMLAWMEPHGRRRRWRSQNNKLVEV
jgi:hypothetical protein